MTEVGKKAYLVSLKHKLKKHLQRQSASANQVDHRWLNGFMAADEKAIRSRGRSFISVA